MADPFICAVCTGKNHQASIRDRGQGDRMVLLPKSSPRYREAGGSAAKGLLSQGIICLAICSVLFC